MPRGVKFVTDIGMPATVLGIFVQNPEAVIGCSAQHPVECDQRHPLLGVAATHVRMHTRKPDLLNPRIGLPKSRLEGCTRFLHCEPAIGGVDSVPQFVVGELESMKQGVDEVAAVERATHSVDCAPQANYPDSHT